MYEESETVELKEVLIDEVKNEINAFLNSKGGTIYIGVDKNSVIHPIKDLKERDIIDSKVSSWIREAYFPIPINLITYSFNSDDVFTIEIKQGNNKPYFIKEKGPKPSGVFVREGRSTRKATETEILLMIMASKDYSYEQDVSDEQDLTFKYFSSICEENNIEYDTRHLTSLGLISKDGKYTNLGLLMSDQSPIIAKFAKYDKDLNFIVKTEHKGSLLKVINDVLEHANNYNNLSAIIKRDSFKRIERFSYPGSSLRETILNSFAHANYFIRSNIKIEFYDDKVRITNPGGIYEATLDDIMNGVQTYRNPGLVNILNKLHYIENFGTGIPRIMSAYSHSDKKPIFEPTDNYFIVSLFDLNYKADPILDPLDDPILDPLNNFDLAILTIIRDNPGLNTKKILEKLKTQYSDATIDKIKNSLKRNLVKYCSFKGSRNSGGYYIT